MSDKSLRIAFDAKRLFHNREGLGSYARTLVSNMKRLLPQHSYYLCTPTLGDNTYAKAFLNTDHYSHIIAPAKANKSVWRTKGLVKDLDRHNIDVYWGLSNELPIGLPQLDCKSIVTIHDLFYKLYPEQFGFIDRLIVSSKYKYAIGQADKVLVASQHTKKDLLSLFPEASSRVEVLYQSTQFEGRKKVGMKTGEPYYLTVGSITPRKNLELIVRAYAELPIRDRVKVYIVGRPTRYAEKLKALMMKAGVENSFDFLGQVSDEELWQLYSGARALIFPSAYEGFGIPIIESLTAGIPVIGNASSSIPEMIGKHGIVIEYDSTESLIAAFMKIKEEKLRESLLVDVDRHLKSFRSQEVVAQVGLILDKLLM